MSKMCQLCSFHTTSLPFYLKHLTLIHSTEPGFRIQCRLNGCVRSYSNIRTYKNHVYSCHSKSHHTVLVEDEAANHSDGEIVMDGMKMAIVSVAYISTSIRLHQCVCVRVCVFMCVWCVCVSEGVLCVRA